MDEERREGRREGVREAGTAPASGERYLGVWLRCVASLCGFAGPLVEAGPSCLASPLTPPPPPPLLEL